MKLFKTVQDLIITAIYDERSNYFASANSTQTGHNDLEDLDEYRNIFIDDDEIQSRIRITQYKMKKPLDSVDILEMLRKNKMFPEFNVSKPTIQEAIDYHNYGGEENPFLRSFYEWNRKFDHQIIAHRSHHHKGVVMIIKVSRDEFIVADFSDTI